MVGFYDTTLGGSLAVESQGTDAIPSSTGEVLGAAAGGGFAHAFPTFEIGRLNVELGVDPNTGMPLPEGTFGRTLSPDEANEQFGIKGRLSWAAPVPKGVAREQQQRARERIAREDVIARREGGLLTGTAARFGAGLAGGLPGLVDPLNIAVSFLPVVPAARAALWAARAPIAGRFAEGALAGAAGGALLTPLQYGLSRAEGEDYGAVDALLNIALGGMFGGGLHAGAGLLGRDAAPLTARVEALDPAAREALLRGAVADLAADRPVESPAALLRLPQGMIYPPGEGSASPYLAVPREPQRLASFLQREGGVQNQGGELGHIGGDARPGLINRGGMTLDDAALKAWEAGFLGAGERPDINTLIDALARDLKEAPVYRAGDEPAAAGYREAVDHNGEIDRLAAAYGLPTRSLDRARFDELVRDAQLRGEWLPDFGEAPRRVEFPADFPDVIVQRPAGSGGSRLIDHPDYQAAKSGDRDAALRVAGAQLEPAKLDALRALIGDKKPILVAVYAEDVGRNQIPLAYAVQLGQRLGLPVEGDIVQLTRNARTGADARSRLVSRVEFGGPVIPGRDYLIVDDLVTQGGTLADLRSYIESQGGHAIGATTLGSAEFGHMLAPRPEPLAALRAKFPELDQWWRGQYGYGLQGLTNSEIHYLGQFRSFDAIRSEFIARREAGGPGLHAEPVAAGPERGTAGEFAPGRTYTPDELILRALGRDELAEPPPPFFEGAGRPASDVPVGANWGQALDHRSMLDVLREETEQLIAELKQHLPEGATSPELEAAERVVAELEGNARAIEQGAICLGRRL